MPVGFDPHRELARIQELRDLLAQRQQDAITNDKDQPAIGDHYEFIGSSKSTHDCEAQRPEVR